jgi:hypothetical protein
MKKDEILSMARYIFDVAADGRGRETFSGDSFGIERFAALVAEKATEQANARQNASWARMCEKMVAAERKECVTILHDNAIKSKGTAVHALIASAQQIEERGQK